MGGIMIKKVMIFSFLAIFLLTTIGCTGELKTYDSFSKERIGLLEDFYLIAFPDGVEYEKAVFESSRDNSFRLIIKYPHDAFNDFIKSADTTYLSTAGQNIGSFSSTLFTYSSTPFYSQETRTYVCYSTNNGEDYVELYSTRYFEDVDEFDKFN